jgi:CRP/FNR family cyclic AMP-dependent transcriptional regulator
MKNNHQDKFDAKETLRETELFKFLDDEALDQVLKLIKWKQYRQGVEVIPYRDKSDDVYFIASGQVRITIFSFAGKEISYEELGSGEMFGELSAIDQLPRTANVITLGVAHIGAMSRSDFWRLIDRYPGVAAASLKRLARVVRFLVDRVYQYGALDVKDRVRTEVLRLARESMSSDDSATIQHFPTHNEIANRVNTHREAVTRELNELSRMGLIEQNQRVLTVLAVSRLMELLPEDIWFES